jgi:hypothetical protein
MTSQGPTGVNPLLAFGEQWLEWWRHADALGRGALEWLAFCYDTRQLRNQWLAGMTQTMDRYVRSPAFLRLMEYNLRALTRPIPVVFPYRFR